VDDRPHPCHREACADVDRELLADAEVDDAVRVPRDRVGEVLLGDVGQDERDGQVVVEEVSRRDSELLSHLQAHPYPSISATTNVGACSSV